MALKRYVKASPYASAPHRAVRSGGWYLLYLLSSLFLTAGFALLVYNFAVPYFSLAADSSYVRPVSPEYFSALLKTQEGFYFKEFSSLNSSPPPRDDYPPLFYLTIPSLGIKNAVVETYSTSLSPDTRLGHLRGSALPGEKGEIVIYGHSTLPVLFKPSDYQTIFSRLDKVREGEEIVINFDNRNYRYLVRRSEVLSSEEVKPLLKQTQSQRLLLVTCYPFGRVDKRFLLHAERVE